MSTAPSTKYVTSEPSDVTAEFVPPSPHTSPAGQGVGVGSAPGVCGSPAETGREGMNASRAHASAQDNSSFLKVVSPVVEVVENGSRFAATTFNHTAPIDADLVLFRTLADRNDLDSLTQLCRERLLTARDGLTSLRWTKDRAIVECLRGEFAAAYDLLASIHYFAITVSGRPRGKYENEFGIVLARLGRSTLALDRFNAAYQNARMAEDHSTCAHVDTARARALVTRGEHAKAMRYIRRALDYARANNDYRLEREACESLVEFGEVGAR